MPNMDGIEALPRIREAAPETSVLVLTGFDQATVREQALELGASAYLVKGVSPPELVRAIRRLCAEEAG